MYRSIEKEALQTLLYGILSCQCPVDDEVERSLFEEYINRGGCAADPVLPLAPFLAAATANPVKTPLHLFLDFCRQQEPSPEETSKTIITHNDAIRYFCSRFHFSTVMASIDPLEVQDPEAHLFGHLLLPVSLDAGNSSALADLSASPVRLKNIFCPPEMAAQSGSWYGAHLGMIITPLNELQVAMALELLQAIPELMDIARRVQEIDYADYQTFGDYRAHITSRHARHNVSEH